jgi:hypothetical protein
MSTNNVKKLVFLHPVFIPWESDVLHTDYLGAVFEEIDLFALPPRTQLEVLVSARTHAPETIILHEKGGKRSIVIPLALTYQYCESSDIAIPGPFGH